MWTVSRVFCIGILIGLSVLDICVRKISVHSLAVINLAALGYQLCQLYRGKVDLILLAGGIGVGALFLIVSRVTEEGIGYGDSWAVLILGIYLGIWELLETLAGAFLLLAAFSAVCMVVKKMSGKVRIPFLPFLAAGYLVQRIL